MSVTIGAKQESDFTDPIGLLGDCHRRIERFLGAFVKAAGQAQGGELSEIQRNALQAAIAYFRSAGPRHTADEEQDLFPKLRRIDSATVKELLGRVDRLEADHRVADALHAEANEIGQRWLEQGTLPPDAAARLSEVLTALSTMYRTHIALEDNEVFPIAAEELSAADKEEIGRDMAARRGVPFSVPKFS
ncbi:MAG: hemerythrin domain-containing protein [Bryobacteraceae bacterium]